MKLFKYSLIFLLIFISNQANARVVIRIKNDTDSICKLENKLVKHGLLSIPPAAQINPNQADLCLMEDSPISGSEVELIYNCDGKNIKLKCREGAWTWWTADIHAKLASADPGITATYHIKKSSAVWGRAGEIEWKIFNPSP